MFQILCRGCSCASVGTTDSFRWLARGPAQPRIPQSEASWPRRVGLRFLLQIGIVWAWGLCSAIPAAEPKAPDFNREIRPILSDNCWACHGPDQANRKADLRLDQAGDFDRDEFLARVMSAEESMQMPPPSTGKKLNAAQKELLRRWLDGGARFEQHWAFVAPAKSPLGSSIDDFVRIGLTQQGLSPAPRADAATLVRRVALDLTGLPPTVEEQQRFANAESYSGMVDYYLSRPAFGEHMAVAWLDAARYADSNGYQVDRDRELWPWRDWVVRAFNANLPFDQFTIEQLAGDLLPQPTRDQRIATGFHRNHMLNEEGGIIEAEFLAEYTADRVETTAAVWLGQTFSCCRCHDHKYDPFTQRDFYGMKAFFHNVPERGVGDYGSHIRRNAPPFLRLPSPEVEARLAESNAAIQAAEQRRRELEAEDAMGWIQSVATAEIDWQSLAPVEVAGGDPPPQLPEKARVVFPAKPGAGEVRLTVAIANLESTALRLVWSTTESAASLQWGGVKGEGASLRPLDTAHAPLGDADRGSRVPVILTAEKPFEALFAIDTPLTGDRLVLTLQVDDVTAPCTLQVFATAAPSERVAPAPIVALAKIAPAERKPEEFAQLVRYRLSQLQEFRALSAKIDTLRREVAALEAEVPTTLVMEEMPEPRPTFVLRRGAYDKPADAVSAATPEVLPPLAGDLPRNRLGLARWLVSRENPLTARVTVNRFWQQLFGAGLVRSSEDFGAQGDLPSHPELLDWLAVTFQESGWDVKGLLRLIMMSETYRQSSRLPEIETRERDPANRWLSRGPRHRLPAEVIRDQALAASGLLVTRQGGPAVKPYHPPGLYEQVVNQRDNPQATYLQGKGEDLYRRSLYTYWKRSVPHPAMLLFDAPFREVCAMRRTRSNTPLQALVLLNDPTFVEAARFLGQRMIAEGGESTQMRVTHGMRLLLGRAPSPRELEILVNAVERARADFANDLPAAGQLLAFGETRGDANLPPAELAAFTLLANTLLNLDETITKE